MSRETSSSSQIIVNEIGRVLGQPVVPRLGGTPTVPSHTAGESSFDFTTTSEWETIKITRAAGQLAMIQDPYYRLHDGIARDTTLIGRRTIVNFASYDYLGLNGHPKVSQAAKNAVDRFGTSVSASRLSAGERQVHRDLEASLAALHGVDAAVVFTSGHATNVSVIGQLLGPEDLIICDGAIHNSILEGVRLSGAKRIMCPHGNIEMIERALRLNRKRHRRALIAIEGLYGMDGDIPDLTTLVRIKNQYEAWLLVDEAHAIGVLGRTGRGIAEEAGVAPTDIEIWMGTLSKVMASVGGYIAGSRPLIDIIRYNSPGLVYSAGMAPSVAAAALAAIGIMLCEPERLVTLRRNGSVMLAGAKSRGLDTGNSIGAGVVPIIVGSSPNTVLLAQRLLERGFNVPPAIFPGVAENKARLRFFVTARHRPEQIHDALDVVAEELDRIRKGPSIINVISRG